VRFDKIQKIYFNAQGFDKLFQMPTIEDNEVKPWNAQVVESTKS